MNSFQSKNFYFSFHEGKLTLKSFIEEKEFKTNQTKSKRCQKVQKSLCIDFLSGFFSNLRKREIKTSKEILAKAVGRKKSYSSLIDLTSGLGRDAFYFFCLGFHVLALERSFVSYALLKDALKRASKDPSLGPSLKERFHLIHAEALDFLKNISEDNRPDVIYLDPMFSDELKRKKKSLPRQNIQILREIEREELKSGIQKTDVQVLLKGALEKAKFRVVLKRPLKAPILFENLNHYVFKGKSIRYDTYFCSSHSLSKIKTKAIKDQA